MDDQPGVTLIKIQASALPEPDNQLQHRNDESAGEHQSAPGHGRQRLDPSQVIQRLDPWSLVARPVGPASTTLAVQHDHHHQEQQTGELRGGRQAEESVPGLVDGRGEGVEVEHRHGPEVRQGFHQRQRNTRANGRPSHRQCHPPERLPRRLSQDPRRFHQAFALGEERGARQQIYVGIEHQHEHDNYAARGAHTRQTQPRTKPFAQQRLHRAREIQQADEDEGQHVGRNSERQHQRPIKPASTGELAKAGQPGKAHA
ncbi:hypothetical protein D3C85_1243060 [compost metagenome]